MAFIPSPIPGGGSMYMYKRLDDPVTRAKKLYCLGCGGMAATFDCFKIDGINKIPVAIKQVSLPKAAADKFEAYELRGLQAVAGRAHPNIVKYLGMFKGDDAPGKTRLSFVFERCPTAVAFPVDAQSNDKGVVVPAEHLLQQDTTQGCDLTSNPFVRPPRTPREARYICAQLLSALAYLHRQTPPIVFRDVKPDNVLIWGVDSDPDTGEQLLTVKLTDYGTVRQLDVRDMTAGSGTKQFMAPEVDEAATPQPSQSCSSSSGGARAAKSSAASFTAKPVALYDTSVDVFSVGATFFYLVTGVAPDGNTKLEWKERFGARLPFEAAPHSKQQHALSGDGAAAMVVSPRDQMNVDVPGGSTTPRDVAAAAAAPPSLFESSRRGDTAAATASAAAGKKPAESVFSHFFPRGSHARVFLESLVHRAPTASPADEPHSRTGSVSSSVTASINTSSSDGGGMTPLTPSVTTTTTTTSVEGAPRSGSGSSAPKRWTAEQALEYLHSTWTDAIAKDEQLRAAQQQR